MASGNVVVLLLTLYAAGGAAVFWHVDRKEMKKEVPYGDFPSLVSLSLVRKTLLAVFLVIGTGTMIVLTVQLAVDFLVFLWQDLTSRGN